MLRPRSSALFETTTSVHDATCDPRSSAAQLPGSSSQAARAQYIGWRMPMQDKVLSTGSDITEAYGWG